MAIQETLQADEFKQQLRDSLQRETRNTRAIKIARHDNVYISGDQADMVYFIESGQVKLLMLSSDGKECLLAIHGSGELKISHEELSEMVGTTRPRISLFMQRFHNLGLIETNRDRFLVIKENRLTDYLAQIA